jgi:hypothetical protein
MPTTRVRNPWFHPIWATLGGVALLVFVFSFPDLTESAVAARKTKGGHHGVTTYSGSATCNQCHAGKALEVYQSEHYQWKGKLGKINDFCIFPDINWLAEFPAGSGTAAGCGTCHVGFGNTKPQRTGTPFYGNAAFPATPSTDQLNKIDCLVCHSDLYKRVAVMENGTPVIKPDPTLNMAQVLAGIRRTPSKQACLNCHAKAGGGDGLKQGDLNMSMANPTASVDVHMAATSVGGAGMNCVSCHTVSAHKIAGKGADLRVADAGAPAMKTCTTCHGSAPHEEGDLNEHVSRTDCTACHIPTYGRGVLTETGRDFQTLALYGDRWEAKRTMATAPLIPKLMKYNGTSYFAALGQPLPELNDGSFLIAGPASAAPGGSTTGKYYPFKEHTNTMWVDANDWLIPVKSTTLWGSQNSLNLALSQGYELTFNKTLGSKFPVITKRYLALYHQVAPKSMVRSRSTCTQCHH